MPSFEEYCNEIRPLWNTRWLTNAGEKSQSLERQLCEKLEVAHTTLFCNGHLALESALQMLDLPKGGEIITTPFTFASTTHAIVRCGYVPVFCDIDEFDFTIDVERIPQLITERTVAILPVHVYGNLCDVERIGSIARQYGLKVIYDAAHAFGISYKGRGIASFGDASMFSFHATKVFHTVEGGAVCYNNDAYERRLKDLRNFGIRDAETVAYPGLNAKMSEFHASMGICNLRHLDDQIAKRKLAFERYVQRLQGIAGIQLARQKEQVVSNYAYFPVVFDHFRNRTRDEIHQLLDSNGIGARKYFYPLTCDFDCYRDETFSISADVPVARRIAEQVLTLPLYSDLSLSDVDRICDIILGQ